MRIAMIGAGGDTFALRLVRDLLAFERAQDATFALTDIDPVGPERTRRLAERPIDGQAHRRPRHPTVGLWQSALRTAVMNLTDHFVHRVEPPRVGVPAVLPPHAGGDPRGRAGRARAPAAERGVRRLHRRLPPHRRPACAAINLASIAVQSCAVRAVQDRSRELVHAAVALDSLTAAVLPLPRIHAMVDEMLAAESAWLPRL